MLVLQDFGYRKTTKLRVERTLEAIMLDSYQKTTAAQSLRTSNERIGEHCMFFMKLKVQDKVIQNVKYVITKQSSRAWVITLISMAQRRKSSPL